MRRECRLVAPANACRPEDSCATWTREIARACEAAGADAPPVCEAYGGIDDGDEDDE